VSLPSNRGAVADLKSRGLYVIPVDQECGLAISKQLLPPAPPTLTR